MFWQYRDSLQSLLLLLHWYQVIRFGNRDPTEPRNWPKLLCSNDLIRSLMPYHYFTIPIPQMFMYIINLSFIIYPSKRIYHTNFINNHPTCDVPGVAISCVQTNKLSRWVGWEKLTPPPAVWSSQWHDSSGNWLHCAVEHTGSGCDSIILNTSTHHNQYPLCLYAVCTAHRYVENKNYYGSLLLSKPESSVKWL